MKIAIHQPNCLPNLSFFYKMVCADLFVIVTNLQFEKLEGWQRRNKICGAHRDIWLTVPVLGSRTQMIKDVMINTASDWQYRHKQSLQHSYCKTNQKEMLAQITALYNQPWDRLVDFNLACIMLLKDMLKIPTPVVLEEEITGVKHTLIINTCKKYGGDTYISGLGAKSYISPERIEELEKEGIAHSFVDKDFSTLPYSAIHYLLKDGPEETTSIITNEERRILAMV